MDIKGHTAIVLADPNAQGLIPILIPTVSGRGSPAGGGGAFNLAISK